MNKRLVACVILALLAGVIAVSAIAEQVSTTVVMRVSQMTRNAVVNERDDLTMEVTVDGVVPASYQWYFNNEAIPGADQKAYSIREATPEDAGTYRMDAFDDNGKLVVSIEISARVISREAPQTGDSTLPVSAVMGIMAFAGAVLVLSMRRRTAG